MVPAKQGGVGDPQALCLKYKEASDIKLIHTLPAAAACDTIWHGWVGGCKPGARAPFASNMAARGECLTCMGCARFLDMPGICLVSELNPNIALGYLCPPPLSWWEGLSPPPWDPHNHICPKENPWFGLSYRKGGDLRRISTRQQKCSTHLRHS